jgi:tRNA(fMet)-specific endonuclease VapC
MAYLGGVRSVAQQAHAYYQLRQHLEHYRQMPVLTFDDAAVVVFQRLRHMRLSIGTMDVKIAAIVLSRDAMLLSRNVADFRHIPGLQVEDWTT